MAKSSERDRESRDFSFYNDLSQQNRKLTIPKQNFDHLFAANSPFTAEGKPHSSHYIQSKIVRAKERIEAELGGGKAGAEAAAEDAAAAGGAGKGSP